jgi:hypothetical protein
MVRWAMQQGEAVRMVLVHEQDPSKGGVAFRRFFEVTPNDLVVTAKLYNTVATALYASREHRTISFLCIWAAMGAEIIRANSEGPGRRQGPRRALLQAAGRVRAELSRRVLMKSPARRAPRREVALEQHLEGEEQHLELTAVDQTTV